MRKDYSRLPPAFLSLLNCGNASLSGELLKLKRVVARHDAIGRSRKLHHAFLVADVGGVVNVGKGGAGFVFGEIAIKVQIVRGEDERGSACNAEVL